MAAVEALVRPIVNIVGIMHVAVAVQVAIIRQWYQRSLVMKVAVVAVVLALFGDYRVVLLFSLPF